MKDWVYVTNEHVKDYLAKFETLKEAEQFIEFMQELDPKGVEAGEYGIDVPEKWA